MANPSSDLGKSDLLQHIKNKSIDTDQLLINSKLPKYSDVNSSTSDSTIKAMTRIFDNTQSYDYIYSNNTAHGEGDAAFWGAALAPNGDIIFVPYDSDNVGIYDPITDTYTSGAAHGEGASAFWGAALAPNGDIIFVPRNSDNVGVYYTFSQTITPKKVALNALVQTG